MMLGAVFFNVRQQVVATHGDGSTIKIFPIRELVALRLTQQDSVVVGLEQHFVLNHGAAAALVIDDALVIATAIIFETWRRHILTWRQ